MAIASESVTTGVLDDGECVALGALSALAVASRIDPERQEPGPDSIEGRAFV